MNIFDGDELLTDKQLAKLLNKSVKTIQNQRGCGTGFPYIKLPGGGVRTRRSVVERILGENSCDR